MGWLPEPALLNVVDLRPEYRQQIEAAEQRLSALKAAEGGGGHIRAGALNFRVKRAEADLKRLQRQLAKEQQMWRANSYLLESNNGRREWVCSQQLILRLARDVFQEINSFKRDVNRCLDEASADCYRMHPSSCMLRLMTKLRELWARKRGAWTSYFEPLLDWIEEKARNFDDQYRPTPMVVKAIALKAKEMLDKLSDALGELNS